ncbi:hypothetical protein [Streptomyces sp. NBC_01443]|uniref:hypothetical protein n=1 Tax=Streptomyces sp. NBC_01443 TaxID=2903868 RepID=UPI002253A6B2|nr:hypothetical protein [Streptomyces sp. NBC_01443]MCX4631701.1 hypothetical protein [Streptomyces sp. NBC_01443]
MTQSSPQPPEPPAGPGEAKADATGNTTGAVAGRRGRLVRLAREGRTRWVALGLVVLIGGGAAAVAAAEHGHREHMRDGFAVKVREHGRAGKPAQGPMGPKLHKGAEPEVVDGDRGLPGRGPDGRGPGGRADGSAKGAPVPLPALPAAQAVEKATAAVEGGKLESLRTVAQQGGGSAWLAVILGPDGVRHAVTLAGADGTVTGNTVAGKGPLGPR